MPGSTFALTQQRLDEEPSHAAQSTLTGATAAAAAACGACSVSLWHVYVLVPCAPLPAASAQVTSAPRAPL